MSFWVLVWQCEVRRWQKEGTKQNGNNNNEKKKTCHSSLSQTLLSMHITALLFTQVQPALESAAAPQISSICLCCHRLCLYSIWIKCLFASLKCQAQRAAVCWIVAIKTESLYVHTHTTLEVVGLYAQIVLILSVLHTFLYSHQRQRRFDEDTHACTHTRTTLHHYHCFSWRRVSAFVCNYRGLKWEGRIFKKREEDGWKREKKK